VPSIGLPLNLGCRTVTLRDGAFVELRPIAPEDKSLLLAVFQRLGKESRYRRFSRSFSELPPTLLTYFTEVDHSHREAIIALEPGSGQALGVARYVRRKPPRSPSRSSTTGKDADSHPRC
jgi:hypothetical protein